MAPVAVEIYRRYGNGDAWASYGVAWQASTFQALATGVGIAILGVMLLVVSQLALGWRQWRSRIDEPDQPPAPSPLLFLALPLLTLFIGWVEELIFRGVLVNGLLPALPWVGVAMLASTIFAVSHLAWDGPGGIPSLPGLGLMGGVLLLARWVMAGDLSLAWGLHTGWIFAIALLDALQLTQPSPTAPGLAGKPDQPLTGLPALGLMILTGLGLGVYTLWR